MDLLWIKELPNIGKKLNPLNKCHGLDTVISARVRND